MTDEKSWTRTDREWRIGIGTPVVRVFHTWAALFFVTSIYTSPVKFILLKKLVAYLAFPF
jgi:hypothetical protein